MSQVQQQRFHIDQCKIAIFFFPIHHWHLNLYMAILVCHVWLSIVTQQFKCSSISQFSFQQYLPCFYCGELDSGDFQRGMKINVAASKLFLNQAEVWEFLRLVISQVCSKCKKLPIFGMSWHCQFLACQQIGQHILVANQSRSQSPNIYLSATEILRCLSAFIAYVRWSGACKTACHI